MTRKLLIATALAVVGSATGLTAVAAAEKPEKSPRFSSEDELTLEAGEGCEDFAVLLQSSRTFFSIDFSDGPFAFIIHSRAEWELTNLETGKTITVKESGQTFVSPDFQTQTTRGRTLLFGSGPGGAFGPTLVLVSGVVEQSRVEPTPPIIRSGHATDLCPILADP
jgi:hypothetical protein